MTKTSLENQINPPGRGETAADNCSDLPAGLSAPARRALAGAGIECLEQLTRVTEADLLKLHGFGPNGLEKLRAALAEHGWSFGGR